MLLQKRNKFLFKGHLLWCRSWFSMYLMTAGTSDLLTLNDPYPFCHANPKVANPQKAVTEVFGHLGFDSMASQSVRVRGEKMPAADCATAGESTTEVEDYCTESLSSSFFELVRRVIPITDRWNSVPFSNRRHIVSIGRVSWVSSSGAFCLSKLNLLGLGLSCRCVLKMHLP
jgi:hypothetical protein